MDFWAFILQLVTILAAAGAVYGGIRADIKHLIDNDQRIERMAQRAHTRLDDHVNHHLGFKQ